MRIRKATLEDLKILHELNLKLIECMNDKNLKEIEAIKDKCYSYYEKKLRSENTIFLIAEEREPIAYIFGEIRKSTSLFKHRKRGIIHDLFVLEGWRGKGVGKVLVNEIKKWFKNKGVSWVLVCVLSTNKNAIKFWRKLGFKDYWIEMETTIDRPL